MATCAVLLGYGLFDSGNARYRDYVDRFIAFANSKGIGRMVLCGGRTDPSRPSVSEAASIYGYAEPLLARGIDARFEEESLTTFQNIEAAAKHLGGADTIYVFCASVKLAKVAWCAMHYWLGMGRGEIVDALISYLRGYDAGMTTEQAGEAASRGMSFGNVEFVPYPMWEGEGSMLGNMLTTLIDIESLYDPRLYAEAVERARRKFGLAPAVPALESAAQP